MTTVTMEPKTETALRVAVAGATAAKCLVDGERATAKHLADELLRTVRNRATAMRLLCGPALVPAEAMHSLESARDEVDRLMHIAPETRDGCSLKALRAVHAMRSALDDFSRALSAWERLLPGEEFPLDVLAPLDVEAKRAARTFDRASNLGE
jgi:hypothetical protein